ncbi:MAG: dienelactone hydrolase family protein [Ginsengibacter sp.]
MNIKLMAMSLFIGLIGIVSCNQQNTSSETAEKKTSVDTIKTNTASIKEEAVSYAVAGKNYKGYVSYNAADTTKRPAILVIPEWWGMTDYPRMRAKQLAELGYVAMAVDMYGDAKIAANPQEAQAMATPYYKDPTLAKTMVDAALLKLKSFPETDTANVAAIGYCFGGFIVLNAAKLGADLKGIVSFHGDLGGVPVNSNLLKSKILICHGEADKFVTEEAVKAFKKSMDSAGVAFTFKDYPNATHAFTNPAATEIGKKFNMPIAYNEAADKGSWNEMKDFFKQLF